MTPRIAIPVPTSFDEAYNRANSPAFARAVRAAGGDPVEIPLELPAAEIAALVRSCDGVLLPGSPADVDPHKYGQTPVPATARADARREATDELLLGDAFEHRKPVLGVCFGAQMLNVFRGGTLFQDLGVFPVNHAASSSVGVAHSLSLQPGSVLAGLCEPAEAPPVDGAPRLPVSSSHHQAIDLPGDGLVTTAVCPQDGVTEGLEGTRPDHFVVGVQWHPERTLAGSPTSRALFTRFVREAQEWSEAHTVLTSSSSQRG